jgi:predicted metal-dependent hydrolase
MIDYTLRRSDRARHTRLTIRPDGEVVVTLPRRAPERWASDMVRARAAWIDHHQARLAAAREHLAARPTLDAGRGVSLGGLEHAVEIAPIDRGRRRSRVIHDDTDGPTLHVQLGGRETRPAAAVLEAWLRGEARDVISRRMAVRARDLGVEPIAMAIRDQRTRWGSASRHGTLSFSWRLVMAPTAVLDYVVVHELAHLRYFGHGAAFWRVVHEAVPEADAARRWLRAHEAELRAALD